MPRTSSAAVLPSTSPLPGVIDNAVVRALPVVTGGVESYERPYLFGEQINLLALSDWPERRAAGEVSGTDSLNDVTVTGLYWRYRDAIGCTPAHLAFTPSETGNYRTDELDVKVKVGDNKYHLRGQVHLERGVLILNAILLEGNPQIQLVGFTLFCERDDFNRDQPGS